MEEKLYTLLVIGEQPLEIIKKFDSLKVVEPYISYYYSDAKKIREGMIKCYELLTQNPNLSQYQQDMMEDAKARVSSMSDFEYYNMVTDGLEHDMDGNAISSTNPDGRYTYCDFAKTLNFPLITQDGRQVYTCKVKDVDWTKLHMVRVDEQTHLWNLCHGIIKPTTSFDDTIINNMSKLPNYFDNFPTLERYLKYSCGFWTYAIIKDGEWIDVNSMNSINWVENFYDNYINKLDPETTISILEFTNEKKEAE